MWRKYLEVSNIMRTFAAEKRSHREFTPPATGHRQKHLRKGKASALVPQPRAFFVAL